MASTFDMEMVAVSTPEPSRAVRFAWGLVNLLLVGAVAFASFLVVDTAVGIARDGDRPVGGSTLGLPVQVPPDSVTLHDGLHTRGWIDVVADVEHPSTEQLVLTTALDLGEALLYIGVLWLLRGLLRSVRGGDPFAGANVERLRGIGVLLVGGSLLLAFLASAIRARLLDTLPTDLG